MAARELYEKFYCQRGEMENRIKEQMCLFAYRLSTEEMKGNQLRLYLSALAYTLVEALRRRGADAPRGESAVGPRLLINGRVDVALAAGADGVHLPARRDGLTPEEVRRIFKAAGRAQAPTISVSCHTLEEVEAARLQKADCILFAPVFEKEIAGVGASATEKRTVILPGAGLGLLEEACRAAAPVPVFALGGVTAENAADCLRAGAAGIAAIRLLQKDASVWRDLA